jgi:hypothetical protein
MKQKEPDLRDKIHFWIDSVLDVQDPKRLDEIQHSVESCIVLFDHLKRESTLWQQKEFGNMENNTTNMLHVAIVSTTEEDYDAIYHWLNHPSTMKCFNKNVQLMSAFDCSLDEGKEVRLFNTHRAEAVYGLDESWCVIQCDSAQDSFESVDYKVPMYGERPLQLLVTILRDTEIIQRDTSFGDLVMGMMTSR